MSAIILLYHRVADELCDPWGLCVSPDHFDEQMEVLRRSAHVVPLQEFVDAASQQSTLPVVSITFDDGYADNVAIAAPVLGRHGLPATFFIVSGMVGRQREFWWDELDRLLLSPGRLPAQFELALDDGPYRADLQSATDYQPEDARRDRGWRAWDQPPTARHALYCEVWDRLRMMTATGREGALAAVRRWAQPESPVRLGRLPMSNKDLADMAHHPLIEIGGHTRTHSRLGSLTPTEQADEIRGCKDDLEAAIGGPVTSFSYPFGGHQDYTAATTELVRNAGWKRACVAAPAKGVKALDQLLLPRTMVDDWNGNQFAAWLTDRLNRPAVNPLSRLASRLTSFVGRRSR